MKRKMINRIFLAVYLFLLACAQAGAQTSPPASWNDGKTKQSVIDFVKRHHERREGLRAARGAHRRVRQVKSGERIK